MGWLIAAAIIALILLLKISIKVKIVGDTKLTLGIGIFRIPLFPTKEKTLKLSDYKIKKFRKRLAKSESKDKKKSKKKNAKLQTKHKRIGASQSKSGDTGDSESDIMGLLSKLIGVVRVFAERFGHHLHIKVKRLVIIIATPDAAQTAVLFGAVCGAVQCLMELLYNTMHVKLPSADNIRVEPDFISEKIRSEADITFSFRLYQAFDILIRSAAAYLKKS
ncbi:MAG: DUF2953 domain-containing protein [Clostridia bacterium]|nr:DUF2953 domain-containing protein [Clostridia bacterium]